MINSKFFFITLLFFLHLNVVKSQEYIIDGIAATVGEDIILYSDYYKQLELLKTRGLVIEREDSCKSFEELILQKLMVNQAKIDSIEVEDKNITSEVERRIKYFAKQAGGMLAVEAYFKKPIDQVKKDLFDVIKDQMIQQKMVQQITKNVSVTPREVREAYKNLNIDSLPDVQTVYKVAQILFKAKESDLDKKKIKDKLLELKKRIKNGEDFKTLAVLYSQDEVSAVNGGELGLMGKAELVSEYSSTVFDLEEGELSEIIRTKFGYHLIQRKERLGSKINSRHILFYPSISQPQVALERLFADSIYKLIKEKKISFQEAALNYSDDKSTNKSGGILINPQTRESSFDEETIIPHILVAIKGLKKGQVSQPTYFETPLGEKGYRIVKLLDKIPRHKLSLDKDYEKIKQIAIANKKEKVIDTWSERVKKHTHLDVKIQLNCN